MRMGVDHPRRDDLPGAVDDIARVAADPGANVRYDPVLDSDIAHEPRRARAIDDRAAFDERVKLRHPILPSLCVARHYGRHLVLKFDKNDARIYIMRSTLESNIMGNDVMAGLDCLDGVSTLPLRERGRPMRRRDAQTAV